MAVVIVAMLFLIPLIVHLLSDDGQDPSGARLLERPNKGSILSTASSTRNLPQRMSTGGTEARVSFEGGQGSLPPTAARNSAPPADALPPIICRELVLPETEARFLIEADRLRNPSTGEINILGGSGRQPLLVAYLQDRGPNGMQLWLHSMGQNATVLETPRAVVVPGRSGSFEILDRDLQLYGHLEMASGRLMLMCQGFPVMAIDNSDQLSFTACRMDGRVLATGRPAQDVPQHVLTKLGGREAWRLRVVAGCDAIVVLATMLTSILMKSWRPGTYTPSLPPASPQASIAR
eukprot:CAMPEP_0181486174 /NCGR_PEP_ID=MMETSP1110-20121109/46974_1 /TAXON_ID=174948 /ORGANISM="Symbiodinium sp., Strain CCMP421" /LENGTH=291 /DNA_ID=CAMNT_0023612255 /DNA_START=279 /DNA_END=1154 /DNA_ORIENTATION=-